METNVRTDDVGDHTTDMESHCRIKLFIQIVMQRKYKNKYKTCGMLFPSTNQYLIAALIGGSS